MSKKGECKQELKHSDGDVNQTYLFAHSQLNRPARGAGRPSRGQH
jgi:hypothetical protein